jgi:hypothetical protein
MAASLRAYAGISAEGLTGTSGEGDEFPAGREFGSEFFKFPAKSATLGVNPRRSSSALNATSQMSSRVGAPGYPSCHQIFKPSALFALAISSRRALCFSARPSSAQELWPQGLLRTAAEVVPCLPFSPSQYAKNCVIFPSDRSA